jgi:hypothetical protein
LLRHAVPLALSDMTHRHSLRFRWLDASSIFFYVMTFDRLVLIGRLVLGGIGLWGLPTCVS